MAPGVEYVRSPKLPPLVFEAQACGKDALYVGVDATGWPTPFPLPILCMADGVEPVDGVLPDWALWRAAATRGSLPEPVAVRGPGWHPVGAQHGGGLQRAQAVASPQTQVLRGAVRL